MTEGQKLILAVASVVATVAETGDETPLGPIYMALVERLKYTIADWDQLTFILRVEGLAHLTTETITLTTKGRDLAATIEAANAKN